MNPPSLPFYQDVARQRGDAEALRHAADDVDKLRATLDELKALQVNGFDPIAAARAYESLVNALRTIRDKLGALEWGTDEHGALELRRLIDEEEPRLRTLLRELGELE